MHALWRSHAESVSTALSFPVPHTFTGKCQAKGAVVCPVDLRISWRNNLLLEERLARWGEVLLCVKRWDTMNHVVLDRRGRIFSEFTRKQVRPARRRFQEAEPRRLSGTASVWCWFALVTGCRERFDTLWPAGDVSTACWPFKKASWQYYDRHAGASSVPGYRRQRPSLHLDRRTRHVGVWSWRSNTWAPINVVLHDHARKAVDQPWTSYACNWVKHDRKSNKNSEAVTGICGKSTCLCHDCLAALSYPTRDNYLSTMYINLWHHQSEVIE